MDQISEIKQKLDIVDVISPYVALKKAGRNYKGLCPFHGEKTSSFMVSQELQIFKCFGCGESGDIFKFVQKIEGVEFPQALEQLAEKAGVTLEKGHYDSDAGKKKAYYEINHLATEFYHYLLTKHPAGKPAMDYLKKKRKLTDKTIQDFNLGYAPDSWDILFRFLSRKSYKSEDLLNAGVVIKKNSGDGFIDKFRGRIIFPFTGIDGKIVGFSGRTIFDKEPKYLNTAETLIFHKGSFIFALDKAKVAIKQDGVIFVEGPVDAITAHQFGIDNVVASSGTALTQNQLKIIERYTKDLMLCFDSDKAGMAAIQRGIDIAEKENFNIKVIRIPEPYKDLDEYLHATPEEAKQTLKNPIPIYDFYIAAALKRNSKETAIGKKKIMEELTQMFSNVSNSVILDHYEKVISKELNLDEETVKSLFNKTATTDQVLTETEKEEKSNYILTKRSPQEYMVALMLKAPLDTAQTFLYKLGQRDFINSELQTIFVELKEYIIGRKHKFDIKFFSNRLSEELQPIVNELYLWDLDTLLDDENKFEKELDSTFERIKKEAAKRELKELMEKIKEAELEKDFKSVQELSKKANSLSEKLL